MPTITGSPGNDTLNGDGGNDTFIGGLGNDVLNGGAGNDTYVFNAGDGSDTINDAGGVDTIKLGAGLTAANVTFSVSGFDLLISDGTPGDQIRITNQYLGTAYQVETLIYGDGTSISLTGGLPIVGTAGNDVLNGTPFSDTLQGGSGNDTLNGGGGNDSFIGGTGADVLNGGSGNSTYVFNAGDGSDTISDAGGTDTIRLGAGLTAANVTLTVSGLDLLISDGTPGDQIRIVYQNLNASSQIETLVYGDGTSISLTGGLPINGTSGNDVLNGTAFGDTLQGGAGNDTLTGGGGNDSFVGGTGADALNGGAGNDTYVFNAGDGNDTISDTGGTDTIKLGAGLTAANVTFTVSGLDLLISDGTPGDQIRIVNQNLNSSSQIETVVYGDGTSISLASPPPTSPPPPNPPPPNPPADHTITGSPGNDTLNGDGGNDTFIGGLGNDVLNGGAGNDTYVFNAGDGSDTINDAGGVDTIKLGAGLTAANVTFSVSGFDLLISDGTPGDQIRITNQYLGTAYQVETLIYGDGTSISLTGGLPIVGTAGNDVLNGTPFSDTLQGGSGNDTLNGGGGNDSFIGGTGADVLNGGSGNSTYVFNAGDGSDTISDAGGTDTIRLGAGLTAANVTLTVSGLDLLISDGTPGDQIRIVYQNLNASSQIETLVYGDGTSISLTGGLPINGTSGNDVLNGTAFGDTLQGGAGNDTLTGGGGNDSFVGGTGADALNGGAGNDTYVFNAGDGNDTISDTGGTDTIKLGAGLTAANVTFTVSGLDLLISDGTPGDQIRIVNQNLNSSSQIETVVYGDGTSVSLIGGPVVGTAGNDVLNGGPFGDVLQGLAGNDTLNGGGGNDTFIGGLGNDVLNGRTGNDAYIFNAGDGSDTINDTGGNDTLTLGAGLTAANVTLTISGLDLLISDGTPGDQIRIVNQFQNSSSQVDTLVYGDGSSISLTAGLPITGTAGNDVLNGTPFGDTLQGLAGNDTLNGNGGNDSFVGGTGNDLLNGGTGNNTYVFNAGDGSDIINDTGGFDTIKLGAGLTAANVTLTVSGADLLISDGTPGDQIRIANQQNSASQIETLVYGDGTSISLTPGSPPGTGSLVINVTYDSSVSNAPAGFTAVVNQVVQYLESHFNDPVTVNITVGYGEAGGNALNGAIGMSVSNLQPTTYAEIKTALAQDAKSADDNSAVASLPATDPTSGNYWITLAEAKALGVYIPTTGVDGSVGFSDTPGIFDYNNADGVSAGQYDFFAAVAHELTEVMGRVLLVGQMLQDGTTNYPNSYDAYDLFHFLSGTRTFSGDTSGSYFSVDGGKTALNTFNNSFFGLNGDAGDWAGGTPDAFNASGSAGQTAPVSAADLTSMDVIGWDATSSGSPPPPPPPPPPSLPDLTVSSLSLHDTTLSLQIKDIGTGAAAASTAGLYLSTDATITTADTLIGTVATNALAAGAIFSNSVPVTFPSNLATGTYFLGVIADYNGKVSESTESNNANAATTRIILGNNNNNTLTGTTGTEEIVGLGGNDTLIGSAGVDTLIGGNGTDHFRYNATTDGGGSGAPGDVIVDFSAGSDVLDFAHTAFGFSNAGTLGSASFIANSTGPTNTAQKFWFNTTNFTLYYDADGSGSGGAIALAQLENHAVLNNTNIHLV